MIGIKVNLLKDSLEAMEELVELVGEPCSIETFTEPRELDRQERVIERIDHPLIERVVVHAATEGEIYFSDPLMSRDGLKNCLRQLEMVPEGGGLLLHPFGRGLPAEKRWRSLEEDVRLTSEIAEMAGERGVGVMKENIPPGFEFPHGRSAEDMKALTSHPNTSLCLDLSHQGMAESYAKSEEKEWQHFREEWTRYLPHFDLESFLALGPRYFHVSDHLDWRGEGLEIGEGERDWSVLKKMEGTFVLEIMEQHKGGFDVWKRNLKRLRQLL